MGDIITQKGRYIGSETVEWNNWGTVKRFFIFEDVETGKKFKINQTELVKHAPTFRKGEVFIIQHDDHYRAYSIQGDYIRVYVKGNKIMKVILKTGKEEWVNEGIRQYMNRVNREQGVKDVKQDNKFSGRALKMFGRGKITEQYLLNKNKQGVYFYAKHTTNPDRFSMGFSNKGYNYILIEKGAKYSKEDLVKVAKEFYLKNGIEKYFKIIKN